LSPAELTSIGFHRTALPHAEVNSLSAIIR